jgi:hypothetical protein
LVIGSSDYASIRISGGPLLAKFSVRLLLRTTQMKRRFCKSLYGNVRHQTVDYSSYIAQQLLGYEMDTPDVGLTFPSILAGYTLPAEAPTFSTSPGYVRARRATLSRPGRNRRRQIRNKFNVPVADYD